MSYLAAILACVGNPPRAVAVVLPPAGVTIRKRMGIR